MDCNGTKVDPLRGEKDWLRLCDARFAVPVGDEMIADLGDRAGATRPGEDEGDPLSKGSFRHRALASAVVDIPFSRPL